MGQGGVVATTGGQVRGVVQGGVQVFRGLPFAAPPVGDGRFRSPRPVAPWAGVREAAAPGPACPQVLSGGSLWIYENDGSPSEDCLYLNVWTPALTGSRPVMVWFHGGAFRTGHGALPCFDGRRLALDGDVVVVTCNYRLGGLGWLAHPDLRDPDTGAWANWGLQDQAAALRWVRKNIAAFGGNPENVTIFGESAGGSSVAHLARNPANAGLCHRVIAQSPGRSLGGGAADQAAAYTEAVAAALGVSVPGLRGVPADRFFVTELELCRRPEFAVRRSGSTPIVDGQFVLGAGEAKPIGLPLLAGSNRDESAMWLSLFTPAGERLNAMLPPANDKALMAAVGNLLATSLSYAPGLNAAALIDAYRAEYPGADAARLFCEIWTDATFRAPVAAWAADQTAHGQPAWVYEFGHPSPIPHVGAVHTLEIPFVFGTFDQPFLIPRAGAGEHEAALSRVMRRIWTTFAHTGDPNGPALPAWPSYDSGRRAVMEFGGSSLAEVASAPREGTRAAWAAAFG